MEGFDSHTQRMLDSKLNLELEFLTPKLLFVEPGKCPPVLSVSDLMTDLCSLFYFIFSRDSTFSSSPNHAVRVFRKTLSLQFHLVTGGP